MTRVTLQLDVEPEDPVENASDALGFVERQVEGDLRRFKEFIEIARHADRRLARRGRGRPEGGSRG